jgi:sRNA-binding protein
VKPLKVGIAKDIAGAAPDLDPKAVHWALAIYTSLKCYLRAAKAGAPRIDLDGTLADVVTDNDAQWAAQRLLDRAAKNKAAAAQRKSEQEAAAAKPRRLGLADLKVAAQRRRAAMEATAR